MPLGALERLLRKDRSPAEALADNIERQRALLGEAARAREEAEAGATRIIEENAPLR